MNRNFIILFAVVTLVFLLGIFYRLNNNSEISFYKQKNQTEDKLFKERNWIVKQVKIGNKNYDLFVTENEDDRKKGLSVFDQIESNQGMLFEFPDENFHSFWMKGMKFDIDIIFLDKEKKIVQIFENVQKSSYQNENNYKSYLPSIKTKYVIELKSGEVKKNFIKTGDVIIF